MVVLYKGRPVPRKDCRLFRRRLFGRCQKGQAVIELALMMGFLAMVLLGVVLVAEFTLQNVTALDKLHYKMRKTVSEMARDPFSRRHVNELVIVELPGKMKQVFGVPFLSQRHDVVFYTGSYQDWGFSEYHRRERFRKIETGN